MALHDRTQKSITASFQLLGEVGRGQYGRVHCGRRLTTGQLVALKELPLRRFPTHNLLRELRYLLSLDHPHITRCEALIHAEEGRFLVLEYCAGGTLRDLMTGLVPLSQLQILDFLHQILAGLDHAHSQGLVHCDIKPENILVQLTERGWHLKLTDFGIARHHQPESREIGTTGSPAYMAPERFYGEVYPASDLYSLGILLYELLTRYRPFSGSPSQLQHAHLNRPPPLHPDVPELWRPIVEQALRKLPLRRFTQATQFRQALDQIATILVEAPQCFLLHHPLQLPPVRQSLPLPILPDELAISVALDPDPESESTQHPYLTWNIETQLFQCSLQDLRSDLLYQGREPRLILPERITELYPLTRSPSRLLALTEHGGYLISPEVSPQPLLHHPFLWHHHFLPQQDQLYWSTAAEMGLLDLQPCLDQVDPELVSLTQICRYYRWPLPTSNPQIPLILYLSPLNQIALIYNKRDGAHLQVYAHPPSPQAPELYTLPYPIRSAVTGWEGRTLLLRDRLDPRRITQVSLSPFQIRCIWVNGPLTQVRPAPWGLVGVTALGRIWCLNPDGEPLAQLEVGVPVRLLCLNPDRTMWIQTSQVLHTSERPASAVEHKGWITQIDLSHLSL